MVNRPLGVAGVIIVRSELGLGGHGVLYVPYRTQGSIPYRW